MQSKVIGLRFTKDISKLVIFRGNIREVNRFLHQFSLVSGSRFREVREMNAEALRFWEFGDSEESFGTDKCDQ